MPLPLNLLAQNTGLTAPLQSLRISGPSKRHSFKKIAKCTIVPFEAKALSHPSRLFLVDGG